MNLYCLNKLILICRLVNVPHKLQSLQKKIKFVDLFTINVELNILKYLASFPFIHSYLLIKLSVLTFTSLC